MKGEASHGAHLTLEGAGAGMTIASRSLPIRSMAGQMRARVRTFVAFVLMVGALACGFLGCAHGNAGATTAKAPAKPLEMQPLEEADTDRLRTAAEQMDAEHPEAAVKILEELRQRHSNNAVVLHELALAYRLSKRPKDAVELLTPFRAELPAESLASLGSALDESGKKAEAEALLRQEIERHPRSGLLYSELASTLAGEGKWDEALDLYGRGTDVEPGFPANYMHLADLFSKTNAPGLSLIYGETFRVLEPKSARSREIAKVMVQVCRDSVKIAKNGQKTDAHVTLAPQNTTATLEHDGKNAKLKMPLPAAFELAFGPGLVTAHMDGFSLATLHRARRTFLDLMKKDATSRTSFFDWNSVSILRWLRDLDAAGHLEAYDYWLYGPAFPDEQTRWANGHAKEAESFVRYLVEHPLLPAPSRQAEK